MRDETRSRPLAFQLLGTIAFEENHFLRSLELLQEPRRSVRKSRLAIVAKVMSSSSEGEIEVQRRIEAKREQKGEETELGITGLSIIASIINYLAFLILDLPKNRTYASIS